jgi:hypothetical protein
VFWIGVHDYRMKTCLRGVRMPRMVGNAKNTSFFRKQANSDACQKARLRAGHGVLRVPRNKKERPAAKLEWRGKTTFSRIMECRPQCGACCIAPSISSPIPGMPEGKPAGVACRQLLPDYRCAIFGHPERPAVCVRLRPLPDMCGATREQALGFLAALEQVTRPAARRPCFEGRA